MAKKKLLFLISTLTGGGAERVVCNLSIALEKYADVDILVNAASDQDYPHGGRVITLGLPFTKNLTLPFQIKVFIKRMRLLRKLKREGGYDACISFMNSSNFANILSGRKYCRVIVSERIMLSLCNSRNYRLFVKPLVRLLYPFADTVAAVSREAAWDLNRHFGVKGSALKTVYNGIDGRAIEEQSRQDSPVAFEKGCFYFLNIGRLSAQKGQWHLLKAFKKVAQRYENARLVICGNGAYAERLGELAGSLGIAGRVIFTGFCKNPYAVAAGCDCYVSTSLYEGFSNVLIEAMACSLPVISSDFRSSAREILAPETVPAGVDWDSVRKDAFLDGEPEYAGYGILVKTGKEVFDGRADVFSKDEVMLSKAMIRMMEDEALRSRYSELSMERCRELSIDRIAGQWMELV